jgi:small subunit ribosomal protein S6
MTEKASYDLMVLLDPEAPDERRGQLIEEIRARIQGGDATLKGDADWGMRRLAYEIDHRGEAQYHLFQFEAAPSVLTELGRSLSIEDAVLRFRTIRLRGEAPEETPKAPPQTSFESGRRESRGRHGDERGDRRPERPDDATEEPAAESAEESAEPAPPAEATAPAEAPAPAPPEPQAPAADTGETPADAGEAPAGGETA